MNVDIRSYLKTKNKEEFNLIKILTELTKLYDIKEEDCIVTLAEVIFEDRFYTITEKDSLFQDFNDNNFESKSSSYNSDKNQVNDPLYSPSISLVLFKKPSFFINLEDFILTVLKLEYEVEEKLVRLIIEKFKINKKELLYEAFIKCFSLIVSFFTKIRVTITQAKENFILIFNINDELILENKADKQNYFLKLKNYAIFYNEYEKQMKKEILINTNNEELIEICDQKANKYKEYDLHIGNVLNFPPYFKFTIEKSNRFMEYNRERSDECYSYFSNNDKYSNETSKFRNIDVIRLAYESLSSLVDLQLMKQNFIIKEVIFERNFYSYKDDLAEATSLSNAYSVNSNSNKKLIHTIRNVYGEKVSFHILFQKFCYKWMFFPVILGILLSTINYIYSIIFNVDINYVQFPIEKLNLVDFFSFFVCFLIAIWATLLRNVWVQKENLYSYIWGTDDLTYNEPYRKDFKPDIKHKVIFDYKEKTQFKNKSILKLLTSYGITIIIIFLNFFFTYCMNYWKYFVSHGGRKYIFSPSIIVGILTGIQISLVAKFYRIIALYLTKWENHDKDTNFEKHLKIKYFIIEFFNNYTSLFYIAFFKDYFEHCIYNNCYFELEIQVYSQMITLILVEICLHFYCYFIVLLDKKKLEQSENRKLNNYEFSDKPNEQIVNQLYFYYFDYDELIQNQQKMIILFGYVCFFTVSCPFVPLICLVDLILDQYFFLRLTILIGKVTIIKKSKGNEFYSLIFRFLYVFGMLVNLAIVLFSSPHLKQKPFWLKLLVFVILENIILFSMNFVDWKILPDWYTKHLETVKDLYNKKYLQKKSCEITSRKVDELVYKRID